MNCKGKVGFPQRRFFWCTGETWQFSELEKSKSQFKHIFD